MTNDNEYTYDPLNVILTNLLAEEVSEVFDAVAALFLREPDKVWTSAEVAQILGGASAGARSRIK